MSKSFTQRLASLSLAAFMTLAVLGSVSELFLGDSAPPAAEMALHASAAPRA